MPDEDQRRIRPNGLTIRRLRHEQGWSPRDLLEAISEASERATGIRRTLSPNLLSGIEEHCEVIPYATLTLIADGLDCDPVDLFDADGDDTPALRPH